MLGSINLFNPATFLCLSNPVPGFPTSRVVVFFVFSEKVRCDCSFCWYWWNCWSFYDLHNGLANRNTCVSNDHVYVPLVVSTFRSFPHSWLIIGFVTRITLRVPLMEQELSTLPEHPSSPLGFPVFSGVLVCFTRSLVLCTLYNVLYIVVCPFVLFDQCIVCPSLIYGFLSSSFP